MTNYILNLVEPARKIRATDSQDIKLKEANKSSVIPETDLNKFVSAHVDDRSNTCLIGEKPDGITAALQYQSIINTTTINELYGIGTYLKDINNLLQPKGIYIGAAVTKEIRKNKILQNSSFPLNYVFYLLSFIFQRLFPKLPVFRKIFVFFTKGKKRHISKAEVLGRLVASGFKIIDEIEIESKFYFVAKKMSSPPDNIGSPCGLLIRLNRIGQYGKMFKVYKFRSMHPYSEFLQQYMYEKNGLQAGGKIKNDFRISTFGQFIRKYWIDEIPMFINYFKGKMKLVGVRPLSQQYFDLYPKELREKRIKYKPGLIPPFYVDMPKTFDEIVESEMTYLKLYEKNPFRTDFVYFFRAWYNILINGKRSK